MAIAEKIDKFRDSERSDDMRSRLVDATIEAIYQNGFSDTTVAKISELANVSTATVHNYFSTKEDLLVRTMQSLLETMHNRVVEGCLRAEGPRGKLWSVIEAVLGEEQSNERVSKVWLAFWVEAGHSDALAQVRRVYNRRLYSNTRFYLRQIFRETGAAAPDERAEYGAFMIVSILHGAWLSFSIKEEAAQDLERCRLMVWETMEMLIGRAREKLVQDRGVIATSARFTNFSVELLGSDIAKIADWREFLDDDSRVFIPHFRGTDPVTSVRAAGKLLDCGLTPIAHVAARNVADDDALERIVAGFTGVGVREFLFLGGGENPPDGKFDQVMQMLQTGILQRHGAVSVGFAGHPEEHPEQPRQVMREALLQKLEYAAAHNLQPFITTQFCFAVTPYFEFWNGSSTTKCMCQ